MIREGLLKKLCFGLDGAYVFWGEKTRVTKQIKEFWSPLSMGVNCVVHRTNLAIQSLHDFIFIA